VRVVGGAARGRQLKAPRGASTRPTSDRVREAVFSMLGSMAAVEGASVVDLFAGSGALGIEALSRGAALVTFVDNDRAATEAIRSNLRSLGEDFVDRSTVVVTDALRFVSNMPECDLLLADPPYAFSAWGELLERVAGKAGIVVAESGAPIGVVTGWETVKAKTYGGTVVTVARPKRAGQTSRPGEI
jgi:16S rRNA (guanine966-N2)-methyltransferase